MIQGASKVWVVDCHPDRLALAERIGAVPINFEETNPVDKIMEDTGGKGADRGCECVGYQATDAQGSEHPNITLNNLVNSVKFAGTIGVVGVYVPQDPKHPDPLYKEKGEVAFDYGVFWFRGQTMGTGQCNVKNYNRQLLALIEAGKARPSFVVSHELPLDAAPDGYDHFDKRDNGWTKVVMHPDGGR
jgi:threonine dehydrogenase-like Zn-dependent dehydrogenase